MRRIIKLIIAGGLLSLLSACFVKKHFEDVSHEAMYKPYVGLEYVLRNGVYAYGIREYSQAPTTFITLMPAPGIMGTTVAFETLLPAGAIIKIDKIWKAAIALEGGLKFEVTVRGGDLPPGIPVYIELFRGNESTVPLVLNPQFYGSLKRSN